MVKIRSREEAEQQLNSLTVRVEQMERMVSDHDQRFDTLQTPLWKRIWFRINGWPGIRDLNAPAPHRRPWHRWVRP